MVVEYLQRFEKQNAQASTILIKVQSIHHMNNIQALNVGKFNWRLQLQFYNVYVFVEYQERYYQTFIIKKQSDICMFLTSETYLCIDQHVEYHICLSNMYITHGK